MKPIALLAAAAAAAVTLAVPTFGLGASRPIREHLAFRTPAVSLAAVGQARSDVWRCQDKAGLDRTRADLTVAELAHAGPAFRRWIVRRWDARLSACERVLARTLPLTGDWLTAVRVVQRVYPGSDWWLRSCSDNEGGWGRWVPNTIGSGAGGWMQYMEGTFWHDYNRASADLTARGIRVPPGTASWYSPLGQAVAAGWAYGHHRPPGKWTGDGC